MFYIITSTVLMSSITLNTTIDNGTCVLFYICDVLNLEHTEYSSQKNIDIIEYNIERNTIHFVIPKNGTYQLDGVTIKINDLIVNGTVVTVNHPREPFHIVKEITISSESEDKTPILEFIEKCYKLKIDKIRQAVFNSKSKVNIKAYNGYIWSTVSIIPKRNSDTIFLKKDQKEEIEGIIENFIAHDTYNEYQNNGVPYKCNILLHGHPGVGKTSVIHYIASKYNIDICTININSELKESDFIHALRSINETSKLSLLVIEDIDCIFTNRKENDSIRNNITLHGLLNCLDGFNSQEGLIIIITTNKKESIDTALLRSRRIDHMIHMTYIDKYQAETMFHHFFKNESNVFDTMWEDMKNIELSSSTFHQFLFNNRKCDDIYTKFQEFLKSLPKNKCVGIYN